MKNTSKLFLILTVSASSFGAAAGDSEPDKPIATELCEAYYEGFIEEEELVAELKELNFEVHETDVFCESLEAGMWVK